MVSILEILVGIFGFSSLLLISLVWALMNVNHVKTKRYSILSIISILLFVGSLIAYHIVIS